MSARSRKRKSEAVQPLRKSLPTLGSDTASQNTTEIESTSDASQKWKPAWLEWTIAAAIVLGIWVWHFWGDWVELVSTWEREDDYSHGFLVIPVTIAMLWLRREKFPQTVGSIPAWEGILLLGVALALRVAGQRLFLNPLLGWSLVFWVAAAVYLLAGRRIFWYALPAIGFLFFMVPLPFRVEQWFSGPMQQVATIISSWMLQIAGQPAIAVGNTIILNEHQLEVAEACSGLRMLMSITALAYAYCVFVPRPWWEKALLLLSVPVVAIIANSIRIAATGLGFQLIPDPEWHKFIHDAAGWSVIPLALLLMWLLSCYIGALIIRVETIPDQELLRGRQATT